MAKQKTTKNAAAVSKTAAPTAAERLGELVDLQNEIVSHRGRLETAKEQVASVKADLAVAEQARDELIGEAGQGLPLIEAAAHAAADESRQ